jgi:hypothetical protein
MQESPRMTASSFGLMDANFMNPISFHFNFISIYGSEYFHKPLSDAKCEYRDPKQNSNSKSKCKNSPAPADARNPEALIFDTCPGLLEAAFELGFSDHLDLFRISDFEFRAFPSIFDHEGSSASLIFSRSRLQQINS